MDPRLRGNDVKRTDAMNAQHALDLEQQRRAGVRRTALTAAAIAVLVFVLFFVKQGLWH